MTTALPARAPWATWSAIAQLVPGGGAQESDATATRRGASAVSAEGVLGALASVAPIPLDGHALAQLRNHGFRCTPGRIATLQVLLACAPGHVTVDEIHQRVLKRAGSATLFSDAKHSWLDALSSAGALAGLVAVAAGQRWGDPVAGLAVTLFICHVGW